MPGTVLGRAVARERVLRKSVVVRREWGSIPSRTETLPAMEVFLISGH